MKKHLLSAISIAVCGLLFSTFIFAQDDKVVSAAGDMYVISAKAGGVSYVEGNVSVARKTGKSGYLLKSDMLEIGDRISTGTDGKAEILLNPGSFVRLGANSEFEFITTDLEDLKLKLSGGSMILEVYAGDEFKVSLDLPKADLVLTKSGVFRVDVLADGTGKISVWKGKVFVGDNKAEVKPGKSAIVSDKTATIAKFDRDNKDALTVWSQLRAKESAKINSRLQKTFLSNTLLNSFNSGGWNMFSSFGVWVFDRLTGRWCFLPFGSGWSSPYGYYYGFDLYYCQLPPYVYTQPPVATPTTPTNTPTAPTTPQINIIRSQNSHLPTFQRFETAERGIIRNDTGDDTNSGSTNWNPSRDRNDSSDSRPTRNDAPTTKSDSSDSKPTPAPSSTDSKGKP